MNERIRVLVADDHALVREGLIKLLELDPKIEIITEVGDGQGAINVARKEKPDVILMDVNMPGTNGIVATKVIKRELPDTKVIALTIYEDEEVVEMVKAGVSAYVLKDVAGSELIDTICRVMEGEVVIHPRVASRLVRELTRPEKKTGEVRLTRREIDVLDLLVKGNTNKEMADAMFISEKTVKNHLTSIFRKLNVKDRTQAAIFALKNHIVEEE
ncbi:MAG TPA: DNA-binding response regulator [Syntrophomonas sp.]|jgi:DNA-binding NarL/FixJ family response regulator|nr:DNA-binding response regulator [Syntrophomonas sp.]HCF72008.1 DNA-binding response regulator [Syntrophomonas sp.]